MSTKQDPPEIDPRDEMLREMRAELDDFKVIARRLLAADDKNAALSQAEAEARAPMLEPLEDERKRIMAHWESEEKVMISIAPTVDDDRIRNDARARLKDPTLPYLPRMFQVNGVQLAIPVGTLTKVPLSIAQLYEYTLNPWAARQITPPVTFDEAEQRVGLA